MFLLSELKKQHRIKECYKKGFCAYDDGDYFIYDIIQGEEQTELEILKVTGSASTLSDTEQQRRLRGILEAKVRKERALEKDKGRISRITDVENISYYINFLLRGVPESIIKESDKKLKLLKSINWR